LIELIADFYIGSDRGLHVRQRGFYPLYDIPGRSVRTFGHRYINRTLSVDKRIAACNIRPETYGCDVSDINRRAATQLQRYFLQILNIFYDAVLGCEIGSVPDADVTGGSNAVKFDQCLYDLIGRKIVGAYLFRIEGHHHGLLISAEGWGRRDAGKRREHGADPEKSEVIDLGERARLGAEHQLTDGYASGVKTHDEGGDRSRRHEGPGAVDITYDFGHSLRHIRTFIELDLDERSTLDTLRIDIFHPGYIKKMVFVVGGDEPFHLVR